MRRSPLFLMTVILSGCLLACAGGTEAPPPEQCTNGADDDRDGLTDCFDPDCAAHVACQAAAENCVNGVDDDRDGYIDCLDPDCAAHAACQTAAENCTNGVDDDGDGRVDCLDTDCAAHAACQTTAENCTNGVDDDGDGQTDCADPDCAANPACAQICTLSEGFESGVVPPTGWTKVSQSSYTWGPADAATYGTHTGSWCARVAWDENLANQNEVLISPVIRCSGRSITFWGAASYTWAITEGNYDVALWVVVGDWGGGDDVALSNGILAARGTFTDWDWLQYSFAIPAQFNNQSIRIAWQYVGADAADFYLDDVALQ